MFHHERIASYAASMVRFAERAADRWERRPGARPPGRDGGAHARVVGDTLFGADVDERQSATVRRALTDTLGMFDRVYSPLFRLLVRLPSPTMRRYRRVESDLNRVIAEMIAERRAAGATGGRPPLPAAPGAARTGRHERRAGARRGAHAVPRRPRDHGDRAHVDVVAAVAEPGRRGAAPRRARRGRSRGARPRIEDLPNLPYTQAVVSESIRLRPPAWAIGRTAVADPSGERRPDRGRLDRRGLAVAAAPRPALVARARGLPARTLARRRRPNVPGTRSSRSAEARACASASRSRGWRRRCCSRRSLGDGGSRARSDRVPEIQAVITLRPRGGLPMVAVRR